MQPNVGLILGFLFLYSALFGYLRSTCWRDPTSKFYQARRAHAPEYSAHRIQEAADYADSQGAAVDSGAGPDADEVTTWSSRTTPPELCIGIPSVRRKGVSYLKPTLGSLQHGLTPDERASLRFVVLLAHTNQRRHPDFGEAWLANMTDALPSYEDDPDIYALAREMERKKNHGAKAKFDYAFVMEQCWKTGAPYILMVEDDVVFMDGWRHRTMRALEVAKAKAWEEGSSNFLYLRLFYYEWLLGWNSESWPKYFGWSLLVTTSVMSFLLMTRRLIPATRLHLTRSVVLLVTFVFTPLLIILYFSAGGNCWFPQQPGVNLMPNHACCGQGLVFPRAAVANELLPVFHSNRWSEAPTDSFIDAHAVSTGGLRYAVTPVVLQHIGGKSSHGVSRGKFGKMTPGKIWNFGFETYNADDLAAEHVLMNEQLMNKQPGLELDVMDFMDGETPGEE